MYISPKINSPLVSVIIPTFNRSAFIERAILTVLNQSFRDLEVIVVDDGSTDNTYHIVKSLKLKDSRILYIRNEQNRGAQSARNTGIRAARGIFIGFLDSDDEWLPFKLESQLRVFENSCTSVGVVYGGFRWRYDSGAFTKDQMPRFHGNIYSDALRGWIADTNTLLIKKTLLLSAGLWDERIRAYQEWDLCIRLAKKAEFAFVNDILAIYHNHSGVTISKDRLRSAHGYLDVVISHYAEISHVLGRPALAEHLLTAGQHFMNASHFNCGVLLFKESLRVCPLHVKSLTFLFLTIFGAECYNYLLSLGNRIYSSKLFCVQ